MDTIPPPYVCARSPEALTSFTTSTANSLLPCSKQKRLSHIGRLPSLGKFIDNVFSSCQLPAPVCLVTLIYLQRLKTRLPKCARGDFDTPYRLFLAAVLASSKYMCESGTELTSHQISVATDGIYCARDINMMERSFLGLMSYDLWVHPHEITEFIALYGDVLEMEMVKELALA
ncbi:cyclin domain-containing protein [Umbelopsis sp. AD052]|nr:cyclin domain-containing protein [Umbelopsis sp. AD052]